MLVDESGNVGGNFWIGAIKCLHLVRINGRELVVATHPQGCALLLEIPGGGQ